MKGKEQFCRIEPQNLRRYEIMSHMRFYHVNELRNVFILECISVYDSGLQRGIADEYKYNYYTIKINDIL